MTNNQINTLFRAGSQKVCKTFIRRFDSDPRLQPKPNKTNNLDSFLVLVAIALLCAYMRPNAPYCGVKNRVRYRGQS